MEEPLINRSAKAAQFATWRGWMWKIGFVLMTLAFLITLVVHVSTNHVTKPPENPFPLKTLEQLRFLTPDDVRTLATNFGTPIYVYDYQTLIKQAEAFLNFPNAYGLTVRFAMKANPNAAVLQTFKKKGIKIDAGSLWEVKRAIAAGFSASDVALSSQEHFADFDEFIRQGLEINCCSLHQLTEYCMKFPNSSVGIRVNPGIGSGGTTKTNVGGPASSFGIWHEHLDLVEAVIAKYNVKIERIHTHIGSGADPTVWTRAADLSLAICRRFPTVTTLDLGGGYKIARMQYEHPTEIQVCGSAVKAKFEAFARETGRQLKLEIEPGTALVATAGCIVSTIQDIVDTGKDGYTFYKTNTGMTEILRPSLYGAEHALVVVAAKPDSEKPTNCSLKTQCANYLAVGHCCESGDLLTPGVNDPSTLQPRQLPTAEIGDYLVVEGAGAYCAGMPAKNYNSFPEAAEVMFVKGGTTQRIRKRQTMDQIIQNEEAFVQPV